MGGPEGCSRSCRICPVSLCPTGAGRWSRVGEAAKPEHVGDPEAAGRVGLTCTGHKHCSRRGVAWRGSPPPPWAPPPERQPVPRGGGLGLSPPGWSPPPAPALCSIFRFPSRQECSRHGNKTGRPRRAGCAERRRLGSWGCRHSPPGPAVNESRVPARRLQRLLRPAFPFWSLSVLSALTTLITISSPAPLTRLSMVLDHKDGAGVGVPLARVWLWPLCRGPYGLCARPAPHTGCPSTVPAALGERVGWTSWAQAEGLPVHKEGGRDAVFLDVTDIPTPPGCLAVGFLQPQLGCRIPPRALLRAANAGLRGPGPPSRAGAGLGLPGPARPGGKGPGPVAGHGEALVARGGRWALGAVLGRRVCPACTTPPGPPFSLRCEQSLQKALYFCVETCLTN